MTNERPRKKTVKAWVAVDEEGRMCSLWYNKKQARQQAPDWLKIIPCTIAYDY